MSKFGVCVLSLGYTRLAGLTVYDSKTREFIETKPKAAKRLIEQKMLYGVLWDKEKETFVPDPEFNMQDILVKSGVGNYRPLLHEVPGESVNSTYMVVRVLDTNKGKLYEVVSNKCQRVKLTEEQLRGLHKIGNIAGVFIGDDEIKICKGVTLENRVYPENAELVTLPLNMGEGNAMLARDVTEEPVEVTEPVVEETPEAEAEPIENKEETPVENGSTLEEVFDGIKVSEGDEAETAEPEKSAEEKSGETLEEIFGAPATPKKGNTNKRGKKKVV